MFVYYNDKVQMGINYRVIDFGNNKITFPGVSKLKEITSHLQSLTFIPNAIEM